MHFLSSSTSYFYHSILFSYKLGQLMIGKNLLLHESYIVRPPFKTMLTVLSSQKQSLLVQSGLK